MGLWVSFFKKFRRCRDQVVTIFDANALLRNPTTEFNFTYRRQ